MHASNIVYDGTQFTLIDFGQAYIEFTKDTDDICQTMVKMFKDDSLSDINDTKLFPENYVPPYGYKNTSDPLNLWADFAGIVSYCYENTDIEKYMEELP